MALLTDGQQGLMLVSNKDTYSITNGTSLKVSLGNNNDIKLSTNMTSSVGVGITQALGPDVKIFGIPRLFKAMGSGGKFDSVLSTLADFTNAQTYTTTDEYKYVFSDGGKKDYFTKYLLHAEEDVNILTGYDGKKLSAKAANYAYSKYQTMTDLFHAGMFSLSVAANLAIILTARTLGGSDTEKKALLIASGASTAAIPIIGVIASKLFMDSFKDTWKKAFSPNTAISANQKGFLYIGCRSLGNDGNPSECEDVSKLGGLLGQHKHKDVISSISMNQTFRIEVAEDDRAFHQVEDKGGDKKEARKPSKYYYGVDRTDGVIPRSVTNLEICPNSFYLNTKNSVLIELDPVNKKTGKISLTHDSNSKKSIGEMVANTIHLVNRHQGNQIQAAEVAYENARIKYQNSLTRVNQITDDVKREDATLKDKSSSSGLKSIAKTMKPLYEMDLIAAKANHQANIAEMNAAAAKLKVSVDPEKTTEIQMNGEDGIKVALANAARMHIRKARAYLGYKNAPDGKEWDDLCGVNVGFDAQTNVGKHASLQFSNATKVWCSEDNVLIKFKNKCGYLQDASGVKIYNSNLVVRA